MTEAIMAAAVVAAIIGVYGWGLIVGWEIGENRGWPRWACAVAAAVVSVYVPLWLPIWAVGRWIGVWPKPRPAAPPPDLDELYRRWHRRTRA